MVFSKLRELSLYIHIPFCNYRCSYCNFYFLTSHSNKLIEKLIEKLTREFNYYYELLGKPKISTLYIGGGTPSILSDNNLTSLLSSLQVDYANLDEFTFEANPETLTKSKLLILKDFNLNRLSLGVQTFNLKFLKLLARRTEVEKIKQAIELVKNEKIELNIDILTGLPYQSFNELESDLKRAINFSPEHISLYDLTIEEKTPLYELVRNGSIKIDFERKEEQWLYSKNFLEKNSYFNYEISNFSLFKKESKHNSNFWNLKPYLGLGPSAVSMLPINLNGELNVLVKTNRDFFNYNEMNGREHIMTSIEFLKEHFITGLRTSKGIEIELLFSKFNLNKREFLSLRAELEKLNIFKKDKSYLTLKQKERFLLDYHLLKILPLVEKKISSISLKEIL